MDWEVRPLQAPGVEGVTIVSGQGVDTVVFKRFGPPYQVGDVTSDAEKVVIREVDGQVRSLAMVRGTTVRYRGQWLIEEPRPASRAESW